MAINVNNVQVFYDDVDKLTNNVIRIDGKNMLSKLSQAIEELKTLWKGKDAVVQINNLILGYNKLVLALNDVDAKSVIAGNIAKQMRDISISNGSDENILNTIEDNKFELLDPYTSSNESTSIDPARAQIIAEDVTTFRNSLVKFSSDVDDSKNRIFNNWTDGSGIDDAINAFNQASKNIEDTIALTDEALTSLNTAVSNWQHIN